MLTGIFPFKGSNDRDLYRKIGSGVFSFPDHVSTAARSLIKQLIVVDPSKRITAG
jgi:serine/threonine protein kinase